MTLNHVDDAEHWRERAAQMRVLATTMKQIEAQAIMAGWPKTTTSWLIAPSFEPTAKSPQGGW